MLLLVILIVTLRFGVRKSGAKRQWRPRRVPNEKSAHNGASIHKKEVESNPMKYHSCAIVLNEERRLITWIDDQKDRKVRLGNESTM